MIIQCDDCTTRFNVPDDKIGTTGTKVRCSKCGAVFFAYGKPGMITAYSAKTRLGPAEVEAALTRALAGNQPVGRVKTQTLGTLSTPPGLGAVGRPPTSPFAKIPAPASSSPAPVPHDPFGGQVAPTTPPFQQPGPPQPLGATPPPATPIDPFRPPSSPQQVVGMHGLPAAPSFEQPPTSTSNADGPTDPFQGTPAGTSAEAGFGPPEDPFSAGGPPASPPGFGPPQDPFAPTGGATPPHPPPPDPFGEDQAPASDPFAAQAAAQASADPFAAAAAHHDPFAAAVGGASDPFAGAPPPPPATDPFAPGGQDLGADSLLGDGDDPFAVPQSPTTPSGGGMPGGLAAPPVVEEEDPFGAPHSELAPATMIHQLPESFDTDIPDTGQHKSAPMAEPPRTSAVKRILAPVGPLLSAAVQLVAFVVFVAVAVSYARDGDPMSLLEGDLEAAFVTSGASQTSGALAAVDVEVRRRPTPAIPDLVVVTGRIENRGEQPQPAPAIEVQFADKTVAGAVGADVDPFEVDGAGSLEELVDLLGASPENIESGESTSFIAFAHAVPDGVRAELVIKAAGAAP